MALPLKLNPFSSSPPSNSLTSNMIAHFNSSSSQHLKMLRNTTSSSIPSSTSSELCAGRNSGFRIWYRNYSDEDDEDEAAADSWRFEEAVGLFNEREYYKCHDFLEALWMKAQEPTKTLLHGILQCAVGFYHLFNQNHKGAMMELGEGLCKLRKMNFESGPFHQLEQDISATLNFIYHTQIELAACKEDVCMAMDQSEKSYRLLEGYGDGQELYTLENDESTGIMYIVFCAHNYYCDGDPPKVKLPTINATQEYLHSYKF